MNINTKIFKKRSFRTSHIFLKKYNIAITTKKLDLNWNGVFDIVYLITTKNAINRYNHFINEANRINILDKLIIQYNTGPCDIDDITLVPLKYACKYSHIRCMLHAKNNGYFRPMILEDDFYFINSLTQTKLNTITKFLNSKTQWSLFYFGYISSSILKTDFPEIAKIKGWQLHCYLLNLNHRIWSGKYDDNRASYDTMIHDIIPDTYGSYPDISFQEPYKSTNKWEYNDMTITQHLLAKSILPILGGNCWEGCATRLNFLNYSIYNEYIIYIMGICTIYFYIKYYSIYNKV